MLRIVLNQTAIHASSPFKLGDVVPLVVRIDLGEFGNVACCKRLKARGDVQN